MCWNEIKSTGKHQLGNQETWANQGDKNCFSICKQMITEGIVLRGRGAGNRSWRRTSFENLLKLPSWKSIRTTSNSTTIYTKSAILRTLDNGKSCPFLFLLWQKTCYFWICILFTYLLSLLYSYIIFNNGPRKGRNCENHLFPSPWGSTKSN